jgi:MFS family permease
VGARRFTRHEVVDAATADRLAEPRDDVVGERPDGPGRFTLEHGPFVSYERTVTVGEPDGDGRVPVTQEFAFELVPGTWRPLMGPAVARALRKPRADGKTPWWFPPQRPDARSARVLGLLAMLSLVVGYHGTLLSQTMTFAADEFGAGRSAQGLALSAARIGGVLAIALGALADRRGRRLVLLVALAACVGSTVLGALSPNLAFLAATQTVNRGAWAAASILLAVITAEEMPKGSRAYAVGLLAMSTALGSGMALWLLPLADVDERAWRVLYLFPVVFIPLVVWIGRLVPESRRYERPHTTVGMGGHAARLWMLAGAAFLLNVFVAPQTQFRNEFLRDERGMSAAAISLFVLATSTPGGIGIVAGGRLADTRGRRVVGATATVVGTLLLAASFAVTGVGLWVAATLGTIFMAALEPTVRVYGPELFPTSLRGRASGILSMTAMVGSVVGLTAAGALTDVLDSFGWTFAVLAIAPMAVAALVMLKFPETARRELEDLNPEDRTGEGARDPTEAVTDDRADAVAIAPPTATENAPPAADGGSAAATR